MIKGNEIRIKVPENWSESDVKTVLDRVARVVSFNQNEARPKTDGYEFSLDGMGNDWWGKFDRESRELVVAYRYGHARQKELEALQTIIRWLFGLRDREPSSPESRETSPGSERFFA